MSRHVPVRKKGPAIPFLQHIASDALLTLEPGYDQDEIFDDQFERRAHEKQRTPSATQAVSVIPAKAGPWTGNNQLGIERHFAPDDNNLQTILKLAEWGFPCVWTVSLGLTFDSLQLASTNGFSVIAHVEAGSGGAVQNFDVDWVQGTTFSIPTNALNLVAEYDDVADIPDNLRLIATIGMGESDHARPIRTIFMTIAAGGGSQTIEIPKFAKRVFISNSGVAGDSVYSGSASIFLHPAQGGGRGLQVSGTNLLTLGGWLEIPNGCRFLRIINSGAGPAPDMVAVCVFELCL